MLVYKNPHTPNLNPRAPNAKPSAPNPRPDTSQWNIADIGYVTVGVMSTGQSMHNEAGKGVCKNFI